MHRQERTILAACRAVASWLSLIVFAIAIGNLPRIDAPRLAPSEDRINGAYNVVAAGYVTGTGNAAVGASSINITMEVQDIYGESGRFHAQGFLENGRFAITGTVLGQAVTVEGRVDPRETRDGVMVPARISSTFRTADGSYGRICGPRRQDLVSRPNG